MSKVILGTIHPGRVSTVYMQSVLRTLSNTEHAIAVMMKGSGPLIAHARNEVVANFLASDADYLWFVDSDISFPPGTLERLKHAPGDIVSAYYRGRDEDGKTFPVALRHNQKDGWAKHSHKTLGKGIPVVDAVGMGCTLINRSVLESLGVGALWPFAEVIDPCGHAMGEDTSFCDRARDHGFEVRFDTTTRVRHLKDSLI